MSVLQVLLRELAAHVEELASKPERWLASDGAMGNIDDDFERSKTIAKAFYDSAKMAEARAGGCNRTALPDLMVDGFDAEQVWAGVELQNGAILPSLRLKACSLLSVKAPNSAFNLLGIGEASGGDQVDEDSEREDQEDGRGHVESEEEEDSDSDLADDDVEPAGGGEEANPLDDPDFQHMSDSDLDDLPLFDKAESEEEDEEDRSLSEDSHDEDLSVKDDSKSKDYMRGAMEALRARTAGKSGEKSRPETVSEDRFFKLDEMDKFLDAEDAKEAARRDGFEEDDDDEVELFEGFSSEDEEAVEEASSSWSSSQPKAMYADLFGPEDRQGQSPPPQKKIKSSFELRQERLQEKVRKMEAEALASATTFNKAEQGQVDEGQPEGGKPWQLKGEVGAADRPLNSLLQEHLDYDDGAAGAAKRAPVMTEAVSKRLEDIVRQRVKDGAFDDVQRKIKPSGENPYEYKKRLVLDQEKSQLSLAQIYEQEYLKQKQQELEKHQGPSSSRPGMLEPNEDEDNLAADIRKDMRALFAKLDALSHFHFTPASAGRTAEVKVVKNAPTLTMEEAAPIAMSDANLLAPQEVVDRKRGDQIGVSERTDTDKKRERRKKKHHQSLRAKAAQDTRASNEANSSSKKVTKAGKERLLKELKKKNGLVQVDPTASGAGKAIRSSSKFFDQLQSEVHTSIASFKVKGHQAGSKSNQKKMSASNLKL